MIKELFSGEEKGYVTVRSARIRMWEKKVKEDTKANIKGKETISNLFLVYKKNTIRNSNRQRSIQYIIPVLYVITFEGKILKILFKQNRNNLTQNQQKYGKYKLSMSASDCKVWHQTWRAATLGLQVPRSTRQALMLSAITSFLV